MFPQIDWAVSHRTPCRWPYTCRLNGKPPLRHRGTRDITHTRYWHRGCAVHVGQPSAHQAGTGLLRQQSEHVVLLISFIQLSSFLRFNIVVNLIVLLCIYLSYQRGSSSADSGASEYVELPGPLTVTRLCAYTITQARVLEES